MQKDVTLSDVAERAGVSKVTVGAVLGGTSRNTRVSDATRQRILDAAADLGYKPNAIAQWLRTGRTDLIGFYSGYGYEAIAGAFYFDVLAGMQRACDRFGKDILLLGSFRNEVPKEVVASFTNRRIDGLVHFGPPDDEVAELLQSTRLPCISIAEHHEGLASICADNNGAMEQIATHLHRKGHQRVAFKQALPTHIASRERRDAFTRAALNHGMEVVRTVDGPVDGDLTEDLEHWRELGPNRRPTAVACWRDVIAWRIIRQLEAAGMKVPMDIAVTGFDAVPSVADPRIRLTTIAPHWDRIAETAATMLIERNVPEVGRIDLPTELVLGDST